METLTKITLKEFLSELKERRYSFTENADGTIVVNNQGSVYLPEEYQVP